MRPLRSSLSKALAAALLSCATACHADEAKRAGERAEVAEPPELGLFGTIPIYWGESDGFGATLAGAGEAHWARAQLERNYRLRPLDQLSGDSLAGLDFLLLAQPRALAPAENVALDDWVREGGRLLLFADPLLTGESRYAVGDRRRPQDVILLSPILAHWGLALSFDEDQPPGYTVAREDRTPIPLRLSGTFALADSDGECVIDEAQVLAECAIGEGRVLVLADAALLDLHETPSGAPAALAWLVDEAFGESAGNIRSPSRSTQ
jgi:hypothetical protein